ncbi:MAG: hypothetical protein HZA10_00845 [Nitrospirae bacterium]|nr:hypothetical protein [Nitrospirota bacterium]
MRKNVALITLNPTLDIFFQGEDFSFNQKIFTKHSCIAAGGSAVNVARGLQGLKRSFKLYIIIGGEIGTLVRMDLVKEGVPFCFSENKEETRVTSILMSGNNRKMFVAPSPKIDSATLRKFIYDYYSEIADNTVVLIGGSVPDEFSERIILDLVNSLIKQGVKVIVDSRGTFAQNVYKKTPYFIKYNNQGISRINRDIQAACNLHKKGVALVVLNTERYCYAIYDNYIWRYPNFTQFTKRIYGRGDAFLAGAISALLDKCSFGEAVQFAIACGASFTRDFPLGEISRKLIPNYLCNIQCDITQRII